jgi:hypothetical protein
MAAFTDAELTFLRSVRLLGRIATVGSDAMPDVTLVGWSLGQGADTIEVRGRAEVVIESQLLIRIHPERVRSWGLKETPA